MGRVFLARHLGLEQPVAIKVMRDKRSGTLAARFSREARWVAKVRSPHVVRILDVDEVDGAAFLVMEYLEGQDLDEVLAGGPLPLGTAVDYALQACEGLAAVHALGIVHRDVKPANLFLAREPGGGEVIKLLDFGISKMVSKGEELTLTAHDATVGSPLYMSPEQLKAPQHVDARADIWSLGIVLYQLLSGLLPFSATTSQALAAQIASEPPVPLESIRPELPSGLIAVILRCLDKDPAQRFASITELAAALAPFTPTGPERAANVARAAVPAPSGALSDALAVAPADLGPDRITAASTHLEANRITAALPQDEPLLGVPLERDSDLLFSTALSLSHGARSPRTGRVGPRLAALVLALGSAAVITWFIWPQRVELDTAALPERTPTDAPVERATAASAAPAPEVCSGASASAMPPTAPPSAPAMPKARPKVPAPAPAPLPPQPESDPSDLGLK
jgi:eukaryotic-like serine/threonine-protein kinase